MRKAIQCASENTISYLCQCSFQCTDWWIKAISRGKVRWQFETNRKVLVWKFSQEIIPTQGEWRPRRMTLQRGCAEWESWAEWLVLWRLEKEDTPGKAWEDLSEMQETIAMAQGAQAWEGTFKTQLCASRHQMLSNRGEMRTEKGLLCFVKHWLRVTFKGITMEIPINRWVEGRMVLWSVHTTEWRVSSVIKSNELTYYWSTKQHGLISK